MTKKHKNNQPAGAAAAKWQQTFQKPAIPGDGCPEPEQVIGAALQELPAAEQQQVQDHLLTCRDCLDLYLDARSAQAEAEPATDTAVAGSIPVRLAAWGRKVREALQALGRPRRLVPALAAVSLAVLVVMLGREEKSKVLPPPHLAMEHKSMPAAPPSAVPSREPEALESSPAPVRQGLIAARPQSETADALKKKSLPAARSAAAPIRLDLAALPGDGTRLSFLADQDAYAYLLRKDQSGNFRLLYSGRLMAGRTYYYPAREQLPKSAVPNTPATVFLVASPQPVPDVQLRLDKLQLQGQDRIQTLFPQATIRTLAVRLP